MCPCGLTAILQKMPRINEVRGNLQPSAFTSLPSVRSFVAESMCSAKAFLEPAGSGDARTSKVTRRRRRQNMTQPLGQPVEHTLHLRIGETAKTAFEFAAATTVVGQGPPQCGGRAGLAGAN
jgi:hypothetical protein